jgi:hypothetical protein
VHLATGGRGLGIVSPALAGLVASAGAAGAVWLCGGSRRSYDSRGREVKT